jgi:hypothetical protein
MGEWPRLSVWFSHKWGRDQGYQCDFLTDRWVTMAICVIFSQMGEWPRLSVWFSHKWGGTKAISVIFSQIGEWPRLSVWFSHRWGSGQGYQCDFLTNVGWAKAISVYFLTDGDGPSQSLKWGRTPCENMKLSIKFSLNLGIMVSLASGTELPIYPPSPENYSTFDAIGLACAEFSML